MIEAESSLVGVVECSREAQKKIPSSDSNDVLHAFARRLLRSIVTVRHLEAFDRDGKTSKLDVAVQMWLVVSCNVSPPRAVSQPQRQLITGVQKFYLPPLDDHKPLQKCE